MKRLLLAAVLLIAAAFSIKARGTDVCLPPGLEACEHAPRQASGPRSDAAVTLEWQGGGSNAGHREAAPANAAPRGNGP